MTLKIYESARAKHVRSKDYNYDFNKRTGQFVRWGSTPEADPKVGVLEIADIEVSTICSGIGSGPCRHCYKSNTPRGENMSFETFKEIFDKLPKTLTQIAFGIGDLDANPDLEKIMRYTRDNGVIPNITVNGAGLTDRWVTVLAELCGGVAVSRYDPKHVCYDAVQRLANAGIKQVNIHQVIAEETLDICRELIRDAASDERLKDLKAIVFLTLKPKGKRNKMTIVKDVRKYRDLVEFAFSLDIGIGFDSCTAPTFLAAMKDHKNFERYSQLSESCESDRFSGYINTRGEWWHCSFTEDQPGWESVDLKQIKDFNSEVWHAPEVEKFRRCLTCQDNRHIGEEVYLCPVYDLYDPTIGNASRKMIAIKEVA